MAQSRPMTLRIRVEEAIAAPPERVWETIEDISSHVRWMEDAVAIRFTSDARAGVGASFDCDTKIGPFRLTDRMVVTEWDPPHALGIRHAGLVTGAGRFVLSPIIGGTSFAWEEELRFPAWAAGRIGGAAAVPVLRRVWTRNLANLKSLVEGGAEV
jgi:uncharacterized protein YndB with AHSA1/START domain